MIKGDGRRRSYHLTPKSIALSDWGLEWIEGTAAKRA